MIFLDVFDPGPLQVDGNVVTVWHAQFDLRDGFGDRIVQDGDTSVVECCLNRGGRMSAEGGENVFSGCFVDVIEGW